MKWSKNFTKEEYERSDTAIKKGITNILVLGTVEYGNFFLLNERLMQPLRDYINKPIHINSGYRCQELNKLVGGSDKSQHLGLNGGACDIVVNGWDNERLAKAILDSGLDYDQLINEKGVYSDWIHISYNHLKNRKQILKAEEKLEKLPDGTIIKTFSYENWEVPKRFGYYQ